jgi:hypothetical protein
MARKVCQTSRVLLMDRKCVEFVAKFHTFNEAHDLEEQLSTILASQASGIPSHRAV